jgi:hypothetical protein
LFVCAQRWCVFVDAAQALRLVLRPCLGRVGEHTPRLVVRLPVWQMISP